MRDIFKDKKVKEFKKRIRLTEDLEIKSGDSGVYIIYSVATDWCYVGETGKFKTRFRQHSNKLKNNNHNRRKLQEIYNEFGAEDLVYIPVCKCLEFMRKGIERAYIYELGLNVINKSRADEGFTWEELQGQKIMMEKIPEKYRIIIEVYKRWKYKDCYISYSKYLLAMLEKGVDILKNGFKWIDEFENEHTIKMIEKYRDARNDFTEITLNYIAITILNDILGKEKSCDVFSRGKLNYDVDLTSDDLIYNIYKEVRKNNTFRNDIILASLSLITYENPKNNCDLEMVNLFKEKLKINNVFDLLYVYIINLFIEELLKETYVK